MAIPLFELLIDFSLAGLLATTIFYCWLLNQRIRVLQDGKSELARVLKHFDEATRRASESINTLQSTGKRMGEVMKARMERALQISDDLYFISERAEKVADRLEAGININRSTRKVQEELRSGSEAVLAKPALSATPEDESVLRAALQAARQEAEGAEAPARAAPQKTGPLHAMIEKIASRTASDPALRGQRAAKYPESRARSRVEQELLEIIRADKG